MGWRKWFGTGKKGIEPPVDKGKVLYVDGQRGVGMVDTDSRLALTFEVSECRGFIPKAHDYVGIARIEGLNAFGLSFIRAREEPALKLPEIPAGAVDALLEQAKRDSLPVQPLDPSVIESLPFVDWTSVFSDVEQKQTGLGRDALINALAQIERPFERDEIKEILSFEVGLTTLSNPLARVRGRWPRSWMSFLLWSDGGDFVSGERFFAPMFTLAQVREYTTMYGITNDLPGAIPFAMDGGAALYFFDTREAPLGGEYPIVFCHCSEVSNGWESIKRLEDSFIACCLSNVRA